MKLGPSEGNSGAIIRWGKYLDNGIWVLRWKHKRLWFRPRFRKGYIRILMVQFHWGN